MSNHLIHHPKGLTPPIYAVFHNNSSGSFKGKDSFESWGELESGREGARGRKNHILKV